MLKRPKPGEDEDDLLRIQEEYLREKNKNQDFKPAAAVTNLRPTEPQPPKKFVKTDPNVRKPSKYAQNKGLKTHEKKAPIELLPVFGDIVEKNSAGESEENTPEFDDDKVYFPKVIPSLLGNIVEKNFDDYKDFDEKPMPSQGFPAVTRREQDIIPGTNRNEQQEAKTKDTINRMDVDEPSCSNTNKTEKLNLPEKSYIISSNDADVIHNENLNVLGKMSEKDILEEQQKILASLDPALVKFLKAKREATNKSGPCDKAKATPQPEIKVEENMDTMSDPKTNNIDSLWENDVLSHPNVEKWLHFNTLENDKLEWMKGIQESKKVKSDEPYEARFNFNGYLMPYTIDYTEKTKTLFHHGEEPHRPGYSLTELFELTRSSVTQQKVMALNTLAGVLEYFSAGTYKDIDIPLSKIFFVVRIALDENKLILLEPALRAMRNLVFNKIDEACLDALIGFEEGTQQPCLQNDMSEIEELESQESELKDFHLAEIDIIAALLRTDIIQRIYYILESVRPSFNCIQYCLQILTRLARDSIETAQKLVGSDHLMNTVIKNFVPTSSINFAFDPQTTYNGKPVLAALKFLRVLSLQSPEIASILATKYDILTPISEYMSSGVDGTYGLRIQIEAYCILTNCLIHGVGIENAMSLCPIIVTTMYKHVQGTDVFLNSSVISATHAAVVFQLVNTILKYRIRNIDSYKQQIYPLLKEGVQKWLAQLSISDHYICGHLRLLCSALDCCKTVLYVEQIPLPFLNHSLQVFAQSKGYKEMLKQLIPSSNLLSGLESKDLHQVKNLMSLGGSVIDTAQKVLPILNVKSPIPFLASLFKLLEFIEDQAVSKVFAEKIVDYLRKLAQKTPSLSENWFTRIETDFLFSVVRVSTREQMTEADKDLLYIVSNKLCYVLRADKRYELDFLLNNIIFNKHWFTTERLVNLMSLEASEGYPQALSAIEQIKLCYSEVINLEYKCTGPNVVLKRWQEPILPRDWIYIPILNMYSDSQESDAKKGTNTSKAVFKDRWKEFIISSSLEWILFNEVCFSDLLNDIDITDRFCRVMCVYLCDGSLFLEKKINLLLKKCLRILFKKEKNKPFNFNKDLTGLHNFQDFYTQFLEQFQSVSYGESTFAACVLVPLAQKHDVKWRKLLWSEYAGCLRPLDCPEDQLCYGLREYLEPEETDESLIKSYFQALSSNLLRPDTVAHRIASHHVECYKVRINR